MTKTKDKQCRKATMQARRSHTAAQKKVDGEIELPAPDGKPIMDSPYQEQGCIRHCLIVKIFKFEL